MFFKYKDARGRLWCVDPDGVWHVIRAHAFANALLGHSSQHTKPNRYGPDIVTIETDFNPISLEVEKLSRKLHQDFQKQLLDRSDENAFNSLVFYRSVTEKTNLQLRKMQQNAAEVSCRNIERSAAIGKAGEEISRFVRDGSVTVLLFLATGPATIVGALGLGTAGSGTAMAAVAGASILKGAYRWQDRRNVGSAILEASTTLVIGQLDWAGQEVKGIGKGTLVVVKAMFDGVNEFGQASMEGKQASVAGKTASLAIVKELAGAGAGIKMGPLIESRLSKVAIPAIVHHATALAAGFELGTDLSVEAAITKLANADPAKSSDSGLLDVARTTSPRERQSPEDFVKKTAMWRLS